MAKVTLRDVAEKANVSLTTVSFAFSGRGRISAEVREKVLRIANELGYRRRSPEGPHDAVKDAETIAILLDIGPEREFLWHQVTSTLDRLDSLLVKYGYFPVILPITENMTTDILVHRLLSTKSRGVIALYGTDAELMSRLEHIGVPAIMVMDTSFQDRFCTVAGDDFQGAYDGASLLFRLGHRKILYMAIHRGAKESPVLTDRLFGLQKAMAEFGIRFGTEQHVLMKDPDDVRFALDLERAFADENRPSAIFAHDDYFADEIVFILKELGLSVPDDVSMIAPGDLMDYRKANTPQITTLQVNPDFVGRIIAEMMIDRLQNRDSDTVQVVKVKQQIIDRGSCRAVGQ